MVSTGWTCLMAIILTRPTDSLEHRKIQRHMARFIASYLLPGACGAFASVAVLPSGTVTLSEGAIIQSDGGQSALYITARPDKSDDVPAAILSGSNGKAPPIASARYPAPIFPFKFELTSDNLTEEGRDGGGTWWAKDNLVVSVRFDVDGVASTRDADDLVGRSIFTRKRENEPFKVELKGRGFGGRLVTGAR